MSGKRSSAVRQASSPDPRSRAKFDSFSRTAITGGDILAVARRVMCAIDELMISDFERGVVDS